MSVHRLSLACELTACSSPTSIICIEVFCQEHVVFCSDLANADNACCRPWPQSFCRKDPLFPPTIIKRKEPAPYDKKRQVEKQHYQGKCEWWNAVIDKNPTQHHRYWPG